MGNIQVDNKKDVVLIFKENGMIEINIPKLDGEGEDTLVPPYVQFAVALMILLAKEDNTLYDLVWSRWEQYRAEVEACTS